MLEVAREVGGAPCEDARLHGRFALQARERGLGLDARVADPDPQRVPRGPAGRRVEDLWHYDVAECFVVGQGGHYLEVELGAGGHFLVLSFDAPRQRSDAHEDLEPELRWERGDGGWSASILLPWAIVPRGVCGLNAFVCARGRHLAYHALPGDPPDFHQPARFPRAELAEKDESPSRRCLTPF